METLVKLSIYEENNTTISLGPTLLDKQHPRRDEDDSHHRRLRHDEDTDKLNYTPTTLNPVLVET